MGDTITPDELERLMRGPHPPNVLDVRRKTDYEADPLMLPGAEWKDPELASTWGRELAEKDTVIYCVRGGSVSKATLETLHSLKVPARYIEGGLAAWKESRKPIVKK